MHPPPALRWIVPVSEHSYHRHQVPVRLPRIGTFIPSRHDALPCSGSARATEKPMSITLTRRDLLSGTAAGLGTALLAPESTHARTSAPAAVPPNTPVTSTLNVNGREQRVTHDI